MKKTIATALAASLALLLAAVAARADVLHLKNGGRVEGKVTKVGEEYVVEHRFGTARVNASEVERVEEKETLEERYERKLGEIDRKDPAARVKLGLWLRENGWEEKATEEFEAALKLDPDHRGAHGALGHVFYEGEWRTEDEIMERKGFVRFEGKWVTEREKEHLLALEERAERAKEREKEIRELNRRMRRDLRRIAYGTAKECQEGYDDLVSLARENDNLELEKFAADAKAYYDRYWQLVREQNALTEVRATMSRLKRPIPTFTTSLGAGSTPVTLQLPELQVFSVRTTVPIPAGR